MKIAYNPKTGAALTTAPANNDITFDLRGLNIFVRGEKFKGTDTTYSVFKKHTSAESGGYNGLVPVPSYSTTNIRFLREDGTWSIPTAFIYIQLTDEDLDDYLDEGKWYYASGGNSVTNKPSGVGAFELYVGRNASVYRYLKLITENNIIWFRYYNGASWAPWVRWYTDKNTDLKVLLSATTTSNFRPLILGYNNSTDKSVLANDTTNLVCTTTTIYAQPSTGSLWANKFIGKIDWSNIDGKPSTFTPSSHSHSLLQGWEDTRSVATIPNDYNGRFRVQGIKSGVTLGLTEALSDYYATVIGWRGWHDQTGGYAWEIASTDNNRLYVRSGYTTSWNNGWSAIAYTTDTYPTSQINKLTGYTKAISAADLATTDTLNQALGKLEYKTDTAYRWYQSITEDDNDDIINKWHEIVDFIDSVKEGTDITDEFVTRKTNLTITGLKTFLSNSSTTGVSLILKNKGWESNMSTAIDFYNGYAYTVPNARIETKMVGNGQAGGTLIFYTLTQHASTNPNPNGLTERLRIDDNGITKVTGALTVTGNCNFSGGTVKFDTINIPTTNGGTTYGVGNSGQILKSNGTTVYWSNDNNSDTWRPVMVNGTSVATSAIGTGTLNIVLGTGITVSGVVNSLTITNAGVRSVTIGTDTNSNKVAVNTNGTTNYLTIPYATTASLLNNTYISDPSAAASGLNLKWYSQISQLSGYAGTNYGFPAVNNANGILWLGTHSGPYGWLMGFSSNGRIYARDISNNSFSTTANGGSWNRIAWTSDIPTVTNYYWANINITSNPDSTKIPTLGGLNTTGVIQSSSNYLAYFTSIGTEIYNKTVITHSADGLIIERARKTESPSGDIIPLIISQSGGGTAAKFYDNHLSVTGNTYSDSFYATNYLSAGKYITFGYLGAHLLSDIRSTWRTSIYGNADNMSRLRTVRTEVTIENFSEIYGSGITWATGDTHGYLSVSYYSGKAWIGGGSDDRLHWSTYLVTGNNIKSQSVNYATSAGDAVTASKWATARTLSLTGSVTGSVLIDGSENITLATTTNHTHSFDSLTSKPTTLSGYGITNALEKKLIKAKKDYENYVILLCKMGVYPPSTAHTINGTFWTHYPGISRYQAAYINVHYSNWSSGHNEYYGFTPFGLGAKCRLVTCTYQSAQYLAITFENILACTIYFDGSYDCILFTPILYLKGTSGTIENSEIYNSITNVKYIKTPLISSAEIAITSSNFNSYTPTLTGTGATGTWGISITGNAATATELQTSRTLWGQPFNGTSNVNGNIIMDGEYSLNAYMPRKKEGGGGWAYTPFIIRDADNNAFVNMGVYGGNNVLGYIFIGCNNYDSSANLQIYPDGRVFAAGFIKSNSSDLYVLLGGGGHKSISDFMLKTDELSNNLTTITKSLNVTLAWMDTDIKYTDLPATGTYIVQVTVHAPNDGIWDSYWSGVMTWYMGSTNATDANEILLHLASHASGNNNIYLRTLNTTGSDGRNLRLQISASKNLSAAYTFTFKFKRVI